MTTAAAPVVTPAGVDREALEGDIRECMFFDDDTWQEAETIVDMLIEKGWVGARNQPVFVPMSPSEKADWDRFAEKFFPPGEES